LPAIDPAVLWIVPAAAAPRVGHSRFMVRNEMPILITVLPIARRVCFQLKR